MPRGLRRELLAAWREEGAGGGGGAEQRPLRGPLVESTVLLSERVDSRDRKTLGEAGGASCERRRGVVAGAAAATCRMTALCQVCGRSQLYMQYAEGRQSQSAEAPTVHRGTARAARGGRSSPVVSRQDFAEKLRARVISILQGTPVNVVANKRIDTHGKRTM